MQERNRTTLSSRCVQVFLALAVLMAQWAAMPKAATAQLGGGLSWLDWTLDYAVSGNFDGLSLTTVRYKNHDVIGKISFPVMRVFYENNICGPYADRLGGSLQTVPWANNATIAQREFTVNNRRWYELGVRDLIGNYDIYQVYYFSEDGILDAHIFSKGLQCNYFHVHYPNWRIDLDLDGGPNDQIQGFRNGAYQVYAGEFNSGVTAVDNHQWRVRDTVTGLSVDVLPGFTDFTIPDMPNKALPDFNQNTIFGRLYKSNEDESWGYGANSQVPFNEGENINGQDLVMWYEGNMPHSPIEGPNLWHSAGVRLAINTASQPAATATATATATAIATATTLPATATTPPTNTPIPANTATPRPVATNTSLPAPTATATATATRTPIPRPTATPLPAASSSNCALESSFKSISAITPVNLRIYNNSLEVMRVYWLDYAGRRQYFSSVWPLFSWSTRTYATHPWVITNVWGTCQKLIRDAALAPSVNVR